MGKEQTTQKSTSKSQKADAKVTKSAKAAITKQKQLKYNYPADCEKGKNKEEILSKRKRFRHTVRRKIGQFERNIAKVRSGKMEGSVKNLKAALKKYQAKVLA